MGRVISLAADLTDEKIAEMMREARWGKDLEGLSCPKCGSREVIKFGKHSGKPYIQLYRCKKCGYKFSDLTGTPLSGIRISLRDAMLIAYLYLKLGLSGEAISRELCLNRKTVHRFIKKIKRWAEFFQGDVEA